MLFDFRAHGQSDGDMTSIGCNEYRDIQAAAKCLRIWEILNLAKPVEDIMDLPNRAAEIANAISATVKQNPPVDLIRHNLQRNIQLVYLDERVTPTQKIEEFRPHFEALCKRKKLSARTYDMHTLLEGTRYISEGKTFEADIFKALGGR